MHPFATLPDATRLKRDQAHDIAEGLAKLLALADIRRLWLYLAPNGDVAYELGRPMEGIGELSLVGVYTAQASQRQIEDDILAMGRERIG